jgi:RHS repeat-associated protein
MMQTGSLGEGILKASENIIETYSYTPYGSVTISDQYGAVLDSSDYGNEFFFQGRTFDKESGLYYFRNRYYSPDLGRFISRDPIGYAGGDVNLYRFVGNNPYGGLDPMGLFTAWIGGGADKTELLGQGPTGIMNSVMSSNTSRFDGSDVYYGHHETSKIVNDIKKIKDAENKSSTSMLRT